MTPDPASRRDNGLVAAAWAALVDVDPRLSDDLLSRLAEAGVPAYVEPVRPDRDRLWVDPERADGARTVLTELHGDLDPADDVDAMIVPIAPAPGIEVLDPPALRRTPALDEDALFQQIVLGYAATAEEPHVEWPAAPDTGPADRDAGPPRRRKTDRSRTEPVEAALPAWLEPEALEPEEDDHFVPPPPPPLRWFHPRTLMATLALVAGVLAIFVPAAVRLPDSNGSRVLGMVLLLSGAGALIWWMRDSFNDPDDGAVV
jgi:hypothetical protein